MLRFTNNLNLVHLIYRIVQIWMLMQHKRLQNSKRMVSGCQMEDLFMKSILLTKIVNIQSKVLFNILLIIKFLYGNKEEPGYLYQSTKKQGKIQEVPTFVKKARKTKNLIKFSGIYIQMKISQICSRIKENVLNVNVIF